MKKEDKAISQILGATLLLLIGLAILSTVYMYVLSYPLPNPAPYVEIVGSIEDGNIVLTHRGGEALDFDTEVRLMMGENPKNITVGDYLDSESKEDEKWGIGEQLVYSPTEIVTYLRVEAIVIDRATESILFLGVIQDGLSSPPVSDALEFDIAKGEEPDIIHVSGTTYAIAYRGSGDEGFLVTVDIAANGDITDTVIDTLNFDTDNGFEPNIIHVSSDIYAIVYRGENDDGFLITVEISADGDITDTVIDTFEHDTDNGFEPNIIHVSSDIYAIAYRSWQSDGWLSTVQIADNGDITGSIIDTLEFDNNQGYEPDIIHISGNTYAIVYRGQGNDGFLKTVEIAADGDITDTVIDTFEYDTDKGYEPDIIPVSGNIYAIAYRSDSNFDFLLTVEIAADGDITDTVIDTLDFVADKGYEPDIIHISGNIYAVAYRGPNDDGFLKTVEIVANGNITDTAIDTFEFDTDKCSEPDIIHVFGSTYAIAYGGENDDGWLRTLQIAGNGDIE